MGINTGWGGGGGASSFSQLTGTLSNSQIPNTEIALGKLNATGTPGNTNFLRGDGAWDTGGVSTQHGAYSNGSCGSTNVDIVIFNTDVGSPSTDVTNSKSATQGSIFTVNVAGWYIIDVVITANASGAGMFVMIASNATVTNDPAGKIIGQDFAASNLSSANPFALRYFNAGDKFWVAKGALKNIYNAGGAANLDYNRIFISRIAGPGATGATGPQGPAGADGANAYPWTSITQTVGGTGLELTGLDGDVYEVYGLVKSGASSNLIQMEFNGSTGSYAYLQHFSSGSDAGAGSYFINAAMANGAKAYFRGLIVRDGTNINGHLLTGHQASGLCHANVNKTITGATKITAIKLTASQAGGIAADSYIYARKVR